MSIDLAAIMSRPPFDAEPEPHMRIVAVRWPRELAAGSEAACAAAYRLIYGERWDGSYDPELVRRVWGWAEDRYVLREPLNGLSVDVEVQP